MALTGRFVATVCVTVVPAKWSVKTGFVWSPSIDTAGFPVVVAVPVTWAPNRQRSTAATCSTGGGSCWRMNSLEMRRTSVTSFIASAEDFWSVSTTASWTFCPTAPAASPSSTLLMVSFTASLSG